MPKHQFNSANANWLSNDLSDNLNFTLSCISRPRDVESASFGSTNEMHISRTKENRATANAGLSLERYGQLSKVAAYVRQVTLEATEHAS